MSAPRWLQHPVTVFCIPLVAFLCLPQIYKLLPYSINPSYDVTKMQKIADLMDDIYGTLANSTFIPHNAITRGPHTINTTAIACKPSASVLRLIELLPYVDISLVQEPDWIYGGTFMDYRNPEHLEELCDPLRGQSIGWTDYMAPSDVALTNWGTGGWNNDRTWVLLYNTERDSIRIFDAELWVQRQVAKDKFGGEMADFWFQDDGQFEWDMADGAPHVLRAIANNYKSLKWTPWQTSNRENGFGVPPETIKALLQRNGWPGSINSTQYNADIIRAKHAPSGHGHAEVAQKRVGDLAGYNHTIVEDGYTRFDTYEGEIYWAERRIVRERQAYETEKDDEERALHQYRLQKAIQTAENLRAELDSAKAEVARFCPEGVCVEEEDMILWEFLALQSTYEEAKYTKLSYPCYRKQLHEPPTDPEWLEKCITNREAERQWLDLAFTQSQQEATAHCAATGCELLPFKDVFERAGDEIANIERMMADRTAELVRVDALYRDRLPPLGTKVRDAIEMDNSMLAHSKWMLKEQAETIEEEVAKLGRGGNE
ncbi:hypothetical protein C7974DRAFT_387745 [Boeremia exigua]|uniref:uncharacterized protein n=1 Tax=Boeremia exigua TaxID=749465 RepID=UPI001E8DAC17|nr:uncharacterized protein C7974DRAFT_387745 [Boeremia exigua]KAH6639033.1 hypothetical protein C7974DRAFT_387745 [Boeremia exigua]